MSERSVLGNVEDPFPKLAETLCERMGPFETSRVDGKIEISLSRDIVNKPSLISSSKWLASHNISSFSLSNYKLSQGFAALDQTALVDEFLENIPALLGKYDGVQWMERVNRLIFSASLSQMRGVVTEEIATDFFKRYPKGKVKFYISTHAINIGLAVLRILGAASDLYESDLEKFKAQGKFEMLMDLQGPGPLTPSKQLSIPIAMLLPILHGFLSNKVALCFIFLLDEPISETRRPFPSTAIDLLRSEASRLFGQSFEDDISELTADRVDRFRIIDADFKQADIRSFLNQYERILNQFMLYMLNPINFTSQDTEKWIGLRHYRSWLAFERLTDELIFLLTEQMPYLRKMAFFRILDQVATLMAPHQSDQPAMFKELLLPSYENDPVHEALLRYKGPIADALQKLLICSREELIKIVIDSVYQTELVDEESKTVTLPGGEKVSFRNYCVNVVRELRNTYHGYHIRKFDKYLSISTGNTPDSLPSLGLLIYLALLASPESFIQRKWE